MCVQTFVSFLDASSHLCMRVCPSVGPSVGWLVTPSSETRKINIFEQIVDRGSIRQKSWSWFPILKNRSKQNFKIDLFLYLDMLPASIFSVVFTLSVLRHGQESKLPSLFYFFIYFHFSKNCCCLCRTRKIDGKTRRKRSSLVRNAWLGIAGRNYCQSQWISTHNGKPGSWELLVLSSIFFIK